MYTYTAPAEAETKRFVNQKQRNDKVKEHASIC